MRSSLALTFVVLTNDREILRQNLLASPCLQNAHPHQVIIQEGFDSAAHAYNAALEEALNDIVIFIHQDVYLPQSWIADLESTLRQLAAIDTEWGVLGCWGVRENGEGFGYLYTPGQEVIGAPLQSPASVQTLDEVVLIIRKSSGLRFNEKLPGFHLYGTEICLAATCMRLHCYAISAFCVHNSRQHFRLPPEFYACYRQVKRLRRECLPIQTSCIRITRFDGAMWWRRIKENLSFFDRRAPREELGPRAADPVMILSQLHASGRL
jgi:hypothetical protein